MPGKSYTVSLYKNFMSKNYILLFIYH